MANYRVYLLFDFSKTPICGFSERYDFTAASDPEAQSKAIGIRNSRRNFLSADWNITTVRLAALEPGSKSGKCIIKAKRIILCPDVSPLPGLLGDADTPTSAVFADFFYNLVKKPSHRQFRGIPDDWWEGSVLTQAKEFIGSFCSYLKKVPHVRFVSSTDCTVIAPFPLKCCAVRRISERRVGRPFALLRGRRSKRKPLPTPA